MHTYFNIPKLPICVCVCVGIFAGKLSVDFTEYVIIHIIGNNII